MSTIAPYVTSETAPVFALLGLPEEVIAVLFAYYSRSNLDLRTNLARLLADQELDVGGGAAAPSFHLASDKARAFHEKWVVGYGHGSVAEHAVVHLAVEGCSIIAAKAIEDMRLGSFTEKSTRYVVFGRNSYVTPFELQGDARARFQAAADTLFDAYASMLPQVSEAVAARNPGASPDVVRAGALDVLRGLLPAGTKTSLGVTGNSRALEGGLSKMLSSPLADVRATGEQMLDAARVVVPTLLKYVAPSPFRAGLAQRIAVPADVVRRKPFHRASPGVRLLSFDGDALARVASALVVDGDGTQDAELVLDWARQNQTLARDIVLAAMADRGPHDHVPRAFEHARTVVEMTLDYGAYRDLQRHRMLTPTVPMLGCSLGYDVPILLVELGLADAYRAAMDQAAAAWGVLRDQPYAAQYVVPLGFRVRELWSSNLRELFHVIELRSKKEGHASYRRVAHQLYEAVVAVSPWLKGLIRVDPTVYESARG